MRRLSYRYFFHFSINNNSIIHSGLLRLVHLIFPVYQIHLDPLFERCPSLLKPERHIIFNSSALHTSASSRKKSEVMQVYKLSPSDYSLYSPLRLHLTGISKLDVRLTILLSLPNSTFLR